MGDPTYYTQDFTDMRLPDSANPQEVDKCIPRFFSDQTLKDGDLAQIEMVEIITPGDRLSRPIQKVTDTHRKRWPRQYAAFMAGIDAAVGGTPIATWTQMGWQMQADFRAAGFQTLEQLAEAHDGQLDSLPNGMLWRRKAQVELSGKKALSGKDAEIAALKGVQDDLIKRLAALETKGGGDVLSQSEQGHGPRGSGRPKGSKNARKRSRPGRLPEVPGSVGGGEPPATTT